MAKTPVFHPFRKVKTLKSGRQVKRWYYYYYDEDGRKIQRSCGPEVKSRAAAEDFVRALGPEQTPARAALVRDIACDMYLPGSSHLDRRRQLGKPCDGETMKECRRYIVRIIGDWGAVALASIDPVDITRRLFPIARSGSWKNRYLALFTEIYREAKWHGIKITPPLFDRFACTPKKPGIFSTKELSALFVPENFPEPFYVFFLLCLSGGLRMGEVRAVRPRQLLADRGALVVDGFCKQDGSRTGYNKKGSPDNPKFRVVLLPGRTIRAVEDHIRRAGLGPEDFCFTLGDRPVRQEYAEEVFRRALVKAGIALAMPRREGSSKTRIVVPGGRKLVVHSLRFTYVTRMRRELSGEIVRKMAGHVSLDMTDYYTSRALEESLAGIACAEGAANRLFS